MGAPIDPELTADAEEKGDVGPLGAGAGTSLHRQSPPRAPAPGGRQAQRRRAPAAQELPLWRRPQSKGRSCRSGRARRDLRVRGGRGHLSERPGWPSGSPISRGSTVSMIAFGGRRGPHRSGSRCRGRPIERREAGREGCLWPNAASQGRPPDGSGGESERSTQNGRAKTLCGGGGGGGGAHTNSELPQAGFPESGEVWLIALCVLPPTVARSSEATVWVGLAVAPDIAKQTISRNNA